MTVRELLAEVEIVAVTGALEASVRSLRLDSRRVEPGDVFFALPGVQADGARFAAAAVHPRAVAVVGPSYGK